MKIKIKKLSENAAIPFYARSGDTGLDLTATSISVKDSQVTYGTGLAVEIPPGHVGLLFPRSSIRKYSLSLSNSVGVIDENYRGEIQLTFNLIDDKLTPKIYSVGERVGQLIVLPYPKAEVEEVSELSDTDRGSKGFGSSGA